ncbi:hypothetical protein QQF64_026244 [Cirrhinus molitorella]|uniref:Uncharacterized protein n=2 Tax=Cirrhinus molitorella TaxID=172907 RepID=A0AA88QHE5_9TELE|nr:hypothetical protein Q8A67_001537 [Cirrhinus molitorella]
MDIISVSCAEIQTLLGFLYVIPPVRLNHTNNPDCDQSWYSEGNYLIADPANPQKVKDPAVSVSSDRLVTSRCVNLIHEIYCDTSGLHYSRVTKFRVRNETAVTPNPGDLNKVSPDGKTSDESWSIWAILVIPPLLPFVIITLLCLLRCRRTPRSGQKSKHHSDFRNYSESRNYGADVQKTLRSDPPKYTVYSIKRDPEADVQKKLRSNSLNS